MLEDGWRGSAHAYRLIHSARIRRIHAVSIWERAGVQPSLYPRTTLFDSNAVSEAGSGYTTFLYRHSAPHDAHGCCYLMFVPPFSPAQRLAMVSYISGVTGYGFSVRPVVG